MEEQREELNWVDRRAREDQALRDGAEKTWQNLRSALQGCLDSYRREYAGDVECDAENGHCLHLTKTFPPNHGERTTAEKVSLVISYDKNTQSIRAAPAAGKGAEFRIISNTAKAFLADKDGKEVAVDQACQRLLEDFLFATEPPRGPVINTMAR
jgi:hypothetical protein